MRAELGIKTRVVFALACAIGWVLTASRRLLRGPGPHAILVQRRGRLGDVLVILPMLEALRARHPAARIVLGVDAGSPARALLAGSAAIDAIRVLEDDTVPASIIGRLSELISLLAERFDVLISGERFALLPFAFYCGAPLRIGFDEGAPHQTLQNARVLLDPGRHAVDNHLALAARLDAPPLGHGSEPRLRHFARATAGLAPELTGTTYVVLHAGAQKPSRRWPIDRFAALAERLLASDPGLRVAISGTAGEVALGETIVSGLSPALRSRCIPLAGRTDLLGLIALLDGARAVVSNDTGVMHLARARGAPLVALLGPENDAYWGPYPRGPHPVTALRHVVPCAPCERWDCTPHYCMRSLGVAEVFEAVTKLVGSAGAGSYEIMRDEHSWADLEAAGLPMPPVRVVGTATDRAATTFAQAPALSARDAAGRRYAGYPRAAHSEAFDAPPEAANDDAFVAIGVAQGAALPATTGAAVAVLMRSPDVSAVRLPDGGAIVRESRFSDAPAPGDASDDAPRAPGTGAQLVEIARSVWAYRELLQQITLRDVRIRYAQAVMGFGWAILMPAFIVGAGVLIRSAMAYVSGTPIGSEAVFGIALKALPWAFFVGAIGFATTSLSGNFELVTKVAFPRIVLPLSAVLTQVVDSAIGAGVVLLLAVSMGVPISATWLWAPVIAALVITYTSAAAIFLACANLFFRDVKYLVQVFLTFGIFFTPVFFEPEMLGPLGGKLLMLNPLSPLLEGLRLAVAQGHDLASPLRLLDAQGQSVLVWTPLYLVYAGVVAVGGLVGSALLFRRLESLFAEHV